MSIVNRLKEYLQKRQILVTQFADACDIPRPTMSQLLNGRNKKVSDELIRKIHSAYPDISVLWLMFGEGPMFVSGLHSGITPNIHIEKNSTDIKPILSPHAHLDYLEQSEKTQGDIFESGHSISFDFHNSSSVNDEQKSQRKYRDDDKQDSSEMQDIINDMSETATVSTENGNRRIVSIIVYYSDNSFESFGPIVNV